MKMRLLVPVLFFSAGLGAGGWLGHHQGAGLGEAPNKSHGKQESAGGWTAAGVDGPTSGLSGRSTVSSSMLDELADDYSPKRAAKYVDSLSVDGIKSALERLAARPRTSGNNSMRSELMRAWTRLNAQDAWQSALNERRAADRTRLLGVVAGEMAKTDPNSAIKYALTLAPSLRDPVLRSVFSDWIRVKPEEAVGYWNQHPELSGDFITLGSGFTELTATDPARAARLALACRSTGPYGLAITGVMDAWIDANASEAKAWVDGLTDPVERDKALRAFAGSSSLNNPKLAMELASQLSSSSDRVDVERKILGAWIKSDGASAVAYLSSLGDSRKAADLSSWMGYASGGLLPDEQNALISQMPEGRSKSDIISSMVRRNASNGNYAQAASLLRDVPDSPERDRSLHDLALGWSKGDAKSFTAWLNQQSDSSDRDLMVAGYSATLATTDPQAAIKWAGSIPDESVRRTTLKNIAARWMIADPTAAQAWMSSVREFTQSDAKMIASMVRIGTFIPMAPTVKLKR